MSIQLFLMCIGEGEQLSLSKQLLRGTAKHPPLQSCIILSILEATAPRSPQLHLLWTWDCGFPGASLENNHSAWLSLCRIHGKMRKHQDISMPFSILSLPFFNFGIKMSFIKYWWSFIVVALLMSLLETLPDLSPKFHFSKFTWKKFTWLTKYTYAVGDVCTGFALGQKLVKKFKCLWVSVK